MITWIFRSIVIGLAARAWRTYRARRAADRTLAS
jgi:hypothetical protein